MLAIYNRLSVREKTLIIGFLWVLVLVWGFGTIGRFNQSLGGIKLQKETLERQQTLIDREPQIDAQLKAQQSKYEDDETFTGDELVAILQRMSSGMAPAMSNTRTQEGEIFNVHHVPVRFRDMGIERLISFTESLHGEPFISLESARFAADRRDPRKLDANFDITSFELKKQESP